MGRIHTDLALETKEKFEEDNVEIRGVEIQEDYSAEKDIRGGDCPRRKPCGWKRTAIGARMRENPSRSQGRFLAKGIP